MRVIGCGQLHHVAEGTADDGRRDCRGRIADLQRRRRRLDVVGVDDADTTNDNHAATGHYRRPPVTTPHGADAAGDADADEHHGAGRFPVDFGVAADAGTLPSAGGSTSYRVFRHHRHRRLATRRR